MRIVIPDDYQDAVRGLDCFRELDGHQVTIYHDSIKDIETLAARFRDADALVSDPGTHRDHRRAACPAPEFEADQPDRSRDAPH